MSDTNDAARLRDAEAALRDYAELRDRLTAALQRCCDETDYCYVCDNHPSHGHAADCPLGAA